MEMIGYTGEGRSLVYEAVELMVADEYQAALKKIEEAEVEQCELKHVHEKTVEKVKKDMPEAYERPGRRGGDPL